MYLRGQIETEDGSTREVTSAGVDSKRGEALRELIAAESARSCLETGFAYAMSSSFILDALLDHPANAEASEPILVSMDPWQASGFGNAGRRHLREAGASDLHTLFQERAEAVLPRLIAAGRRFDAAFIDGDHRFDGVFIDIFYAVRLVRPGGLIVVDDVWMPAIQSCLSFFTSSGICRAETKRDIDGADKYALLRPNAEQGKRAWDHWVEF